MCFSIQSFLLFFSFNIHSLYKENGTLDPAVHESRHSVAHLSPLCDQGPTAKPNPSPSVPHFYLLTEKKIEKKEKDLLLQKKPPAQPECV